LAGQDDNGHQHALAKAEFKESPFRERFTERALPSLWIDPGGCGMK
jgi:hypothetical protein